MHATNSLECIQSKYISESGTFPHDELHLSRVTSEIGEAFGIHPKINCPQDSLQPNRVGLRVLKYSSLGCPSRNRRGWWFVQKIEKKCKAQIKRNIHHQTLKMQNKNFYLIDPNFRTIIKIPSPGPIEIQELIECERFTCISTLSKSILCSSFSTVKASTSCHLFQT